MGKLRTYWVIIRLDVQSNYSLKNVMFNSCKFTFKASVHGIEDQITHLQKTRACLVAYCFYVRDYVVNLGLSLAYDILALQT